VFSRFGSLIAILLSFAATASAGTFVQFRTAWGDIDVELFDEDKPVTVRNFLRYVQSGRYSNMFFHRCPTNPITGLTDFVLQGGGWAVTNWPVNPSMARIPTFGSILNEFGAGRTFSNTYGTLAMAKLPGNTNSASSQFFFNLNDNSFLDAPNPDGYFTVFGRVIRGTNVLNQYLGLSLTQGIQDMTTILGPEMSTLPVTYFGTRPPGFNDLEYTAINALTLRMRSLTNGTRELSWGSLSVSHKYRIEYSTNLPPVWHTLTVTNGIGKSGETIRIQDSNPGATCRFYRVGIEY
jgi:cyclophilin family peptidyl-prolyl cis-trans isomerase